MCAGFDDQDWYQQLFDYGLQDDANGAGANAGGEEELVPALVRNPSDRAICTIRRKFLTGSVRAGVCANLCYVCIRTVCVMCTAIWMHSSERLVKRRLCWVSHACSANGLFWMRRLGI